MATKKVEREILAMINRGLNFTSIAWHLNNRKPLIEPPYLGKEWTAALVAAIAKSAMKDSL